MQLKELIISQVDNIISICCIIAAIRIGRVAISLLITTSTYFIQSLVNRDIFEGLKKLEGVTNDELISVWYNSFLMTDMLALVAVYTIHRSAAISFNFFSRAFVYLSTALILLRFTRCSERLFFSTDYLDAVYHWGVPGINFVILVSFVAGIIFTYKRSREFGERITWH